MYCYAELDESNICKSILSTSTPDDRPNMIPIPDHDRTLMFKKYENGEWVDSGINIVEQEPVDEEKAAIAEAIIDLEARLTALENA